MRGSTEGTRIEDGGWRQRGTKGHKKFRGRGGTGHFRFHISNLKDGQSGSINGERMATKRHKKTQKVKNHKERIDYDDEDDDEDERDDGHKEA